MKHRISLREFTWQATSGMCGLMGGRLPGARIAGSVDDDQQAKRLLELGLNGLARAHSMNYFNDGHRGAALIAAHLMCDENHLAVAARDRITVLFERNWAQSKLCAAFPEEEAKPELVKNIGNALLEAHGSLREVGHNAIFAMHAIRGFRLMPHLATSQRIEGVCRLIRAIKPWRDDVQIDESIDLPPFRDSAAASLFVLREASAAVDSWTGRGQGFTGHLLTFGQALIELAEMGEVEVADSCREAFRRYVTITRKGPQPDDKVYAEHKPTPLRPNSVEYWKQRGETQVGIGHVFKYPYSYYNLLRRVNDETLKQEFDEKAWRVF